MNRRDLLRRAPGIAAAIAAAAAAAPVTQEASQVVNQAPSLADQVPDINAVPEYVQAVVWDLNENDTYSAVVNAAARIAQDTLGLTAEQGYNLDESDPIYGRYWDIIARETARIFLMAANLNFDLRSF
jgi:hypothetical protein